MYELISHQRLSANTASITFSAIPQIYTDLVIRTSLRDTSQEAGNARVTFNGLTSSFTSRNLNGNGTAVSQTTTSRFIGAIRDDATANTFNNGEIYIPNYAQSINKSFIVDSVSENNAASADQNIMHGLWSNTAALTSITITSTLGPFRANSSATLYGVNRKSATSPMATGGSITYADGYWYHTFLSAGTFTPLVNLNVDFLVVAGGGGGGYQHGGGGGAGGYYSNKFTATASTGYAVTVGAGGVSNTNNSAAGGTGSDSTFNSITMLGGGGGGDRFSSPGTTGGSGGGGGYFTAGGAGTPPYGNNGGAGDAHGGGGGGAGAPGVASTGTVAGNGGIGLQWLDGKYYAGGGGGGHQGTTSDPASLGGLGGGGNGSGIVSGIAGQFGTGGGGGGSRYPGYSYGHGGSGVVIVRYKA